VWGFWIGGRGATYSSVKVRFRGYDGEVAALVVGWEEDGVFIFGLGYGRHCAILGSGIVDK
jgi:hypothetical protein